VQQQLLSGYLTEHEFDVVGVSTLAELKWHIDNGSHFDVLLLDLGMPDGSGLDEVGHVRQQTRWGVMIVSSSDQEDTRIKALELGADDYIIKPFAPRELAARVRSLCSRLAPTANRRPLSDFAEEHGLTQREAEVLRCLAGGLRRKQIADQLGISLNTTADHIKRIYRKLRVRSIAEAAHLLHDVDLP